MKRTLGAHAKGAMSTLVPALPAVGMADGKRLRHHHPAK